MAFAAIQGVESLLTWTLFIKWIDCDVAGDQRDRFSRAQGAWSELARLPGFLLQAGGWDLKRPERAAIVAIWTNATVYGDFRAREHDVIVNNSQQDTTYRSCRTSRFGVKFEMAGAETSFLGCLGRGLVLRAAHCTLHPMRAEHFEQAQQDFWAPAMRDAGMLGGLFCKGQESGQYLVLSVWRNMSDHERYQRECVPTMRLKAGVDDDVALLDGYVIQIEPTWRVLGEARMTECCT